MQFTEVPEVSGAFIVTPPRYHDQRGFFQEHFNAKKYEGKVKACEQHVIRGLHCAQYGKLVQCVQGSIIDYFVDLRPESPTYMKWASVELSANEAKQVFVPARCGHGFYSKEDDSFVVYGQEGTFDGPREMNVNPFDPAIGIKWPELPEGASYVISDQDKNSPSEKEAREAWLERNKV